MNYVFYILLMGICYQIVMITIEIFRGNKAVSDVYRSYKNDKRTINQKKQNRLRISKEDYFKYAIPVSIIIFIATFIFGRSILLSLGSSVLGMYYPRYRMENREKKLKELLNYQFRDAMHAISNSLKSGASLQIAIERSLKDLEDIYKHHVDKPMIDELSIVVQELRFGKSLEEALLAFDKRCNIEDISSFVNAAIITESTGGNLTEVMNNVNNIISDKIAIRREINTLTSAKRIEANALTIMPIIIVALLSLFSPEYMEPMYSTMIGKGFMIIGVVLLIANYVIGRKIINIDI